MSGGSRHPPTESPGDTREADAGSGGIIPPVGAGLCPAGSRAEPWQEAERKPRETGEARRGRDPLR